MHFESDKTRFETATAAAAGGSAQAVMKKTVGVMTLPLNANYGGNLQSFALMEALRKLGHAPILINLRHPVRQDPNLPVTPVDPASMALIADTVGLGPSVANTSFTDTYLRPVTRTFTAPDQLAREIDALGLDAVVAGSDQVWRPKFARTLLTNFYFFGFLPKDSPVKRVSYAASFGVPDWEFSDEQTRKASELIRLFDGASVREDAAVDLCARHLGVEPVHVLDPTLLLTPDDYLPILSTAPRERNPGQLLTYILDVTDDKVSLLGQLSKALSREAYSTNGLPFRPGAAAAATGEDKTVQGWLAAFHDAAFVVTDSFHGVAFSILFNKPFIAYGNPGRGMARFTSILKAVGLEDRLVLKSAGLDIGKMLQPIDWDAVNDKLAKRRALSYDFLQAGLSGESWAAGKPAKRSSDGAGQQALDVRLDFATNNAAWQVSRRGDLVVLKVTPGGAVLGNLAFCDFPVPLQPYAKYRLVLAWALRSTEAVVKPCIRNPATNKNHVIANVNVDGQTAALHRHSVDFVVPGAGFTQFVLGAGSFTGADGGAEIASITLEKIADGAPPAPAPRPPSYTEKAKALALNDSERYARAFTHGDAAGRARARLMYFAHAIEKGLSHLSFRAGFGKTAAESLAKETEAWLAASRNPEDRFFKAAISSMHVYFERHRALDVDVSEFWRLFTPRVQALIAQADDVYGGALAAAAYREPVPATNQDRKFLDVVYGRRSVREFTEVPVDDADIQRAVQIASQAPSVCNRQGPRVHQFKDPGQINALINLQGGFGGYKKPPVLLLVTCDLTAFTQPKERNQAFVDGGLFLMSLLLGLEQAGLGACPLNTTMDADREANMRRVSKIPETEVFISYVAAGHYNRDVPVPRSVRYPLDDLLFVHDGAR